MADLPDVDAITLAHLRANVARLPLLDGDAERIRGDVRQPPYPMLVIGSTTAGDDGDLLWRVTAEILFEAWGDPDGRPGKAALRKVLYAALQIARELPDLDYGPGQDVITSVSSSAGGGFSPDPTGQPRWVAAIRVSAHPPTLSAP